MDLQRFLCGALLLGVVQLSLSEPVESANQTSNEGSAGANREGYTDSELQRTYIGYVKGKSSAHEKQAVVKEFCGNAKVLNDGFRCNRLMKSALVGSFDDDGLRSLEKLQAHANKMTSCNNDEDCKLIFYPAQRIEADNVWLDVQSQPHWGLDRLDQPALPLDRKFRYAISGKGVTLFAMDTGIRKTHDEFKYSDGREGSRATHGYSALADDPLAESSSDDCRGHGTQVASLMAGLTYGVAKDADILAVQVLGCGNSGSSVDLLVGLQWVLDNVDFYRPAVVLLPLHVMGLDVGVEDLVQQITDAGVPVVTAAGNSGTDACKFSPARMESALTVGATDHWSRVTPTSNTGDCVDVYAPGAHLQSARHLSDDGYGFGTGTSFAAGLAAGAVAQLLERNPQLTPDQITRIISKDTAAKGQLTSANGAKGTYPLLQVDLSEPGTEPPPPVIEPGLAVNPRVMKPVNLFKNSRSSSRVIDLQIANYGSRDLIWSLDILGTGESDPKWVSTTPTSGAITAGKKEKVTIQYTAEFDDPGLYQGFFEITSNDPKMEKMQIPTELRIFCGELLDAGSDFSLSVHNATFADVRPEHWRPSPLPNEGENLYMEATLTLSQPVVFLDQVDLFIPGGLIEDLVAVNNELCSTYNIRAIKSKQDVWFGSNDVCIDVRENTIFSINGKTFGNQTVCTPYDDKPESRLFATHMSYDPEEGLLTDTAEVVVVLAFSELVEGFEDNNVQVSPGTLQNVKPVPNIETMFYIHLKMPDGYFGTSSVKVNVEGVKDVAGNAVVTVPSLTFKRVKKTRFEHTSFHVSDEL